MKRLFSWIIVLVGLTISSYIWELICRLIALGFNAVAKHGIFAVILVIYLVAGSVALFAFVALIGLGVNGIVKLAQKVHKSKKGARYIVAGIVYLVWYALMMLGMIVGFVVNSLPLSGYLTCIIMIIYSIAFIITGRNAARRDRLAAETATEGA